MKTPQTSSFIEKAIIFILELFTMLGLAALILLAFALLGMLEQWIMSF